MPESQAREKSLRNPGEKIERRENVLEALNLKTIRAEIDSFVTRTDLIFSRYFLTARINTFKQIIRVRIGYCNL